MGNAGFMPSAVARMWCPLRVQQLEFSGSEGLGVAGRLMWFRVSGFRGLGV